MTTKIRISPRIAVIAAALSSQLGQVTVYDNEPAKWDAARKLASIGQIEARRAETIRTKHTHTHGVTYALTDTHDQVLFREQHALYLDLQVAYRVQAVTKSGVVLAKTRRTIARLHAEQEALNAADEARRA